MDLETKKLGIINWITQISDEEIINQIDKIRDSKTDWFADLPQSVKDEINESIAQADEGKLVEHSDMIEKYKLLAND